MIRDADKALHTPGALKNGLMCSGPGELEINVSPGLVDAALQFMKVFLNAIVSKKYTLEIGDTKTFVMVAGQKIRIACREKSRRTRNRAIPNQKFGLTPSGLLCFQITWNYLHFREWTNQNRCLEEQIPEMLDKLAKAATQIKDMHTELEKYWIESESLRPEA